MKVKDVMHSGAEWATPDTPLSEIAKRMHKHDIGAIPIAEHDKLVGMVTDRDIVCKGVAGKAFDATRTLARDVMSKGIHTCRADDELAAAVHNMQDLKVRRLPVIDQSKRLVGMLSLGDIGQSASRDVTADCVKHVSGHHH